MADDLDQRPRVVLDTNVLLQAIPTKSRFRLIIEAFEQNLFVLILSNEILLEYEVRVHGPRITVVQMRARHGSIKADLAALRPEATPEGASVCRTDAR